MADAAAHPSLPDGRLVYAIGDIHGAASLLDQLLAKITRDAEHFSEVAPTLIFLGDYVDRGPDSAGVIERLISGIPDRCEIHCLLGNHEDMLLSFLRDPEELDLWMYNGAETTLASYGVDGYGGNRYRGRERDCRDRLLAAMPENHLNFLRGLSTSMTLGDYYFVHAGVRPGTGLAHQDSRDLVWIREPFLSSDEDFGKVVVHGHTMVEEPEIRPNRIGIDTMAWMSGRLTALRLIGTERAFLVTGE